MFCQRMSPLKSWSRFALLVVAVAPVYADVHLPSLLSDHMVLMRSEAVPIWGKADPGEKVTVQIDGHSAEATADSSGRWKVHLDLSRGSAGPFQMVVKGHNEITVSDVLVGAVWVTAGQSNMEFPLQGTIGGDAEIARSADARLRVFRVPKIGRPQPIEDCAGSWKIAGPETAGAFTAVGYFFAKRLERELASPVGLIDASWSGTFSEMWMSDDAIKSVDTIRAGDEQRRALQAEYAIQKQRFVDAYGKWLQATGREDRPCPDPARFAADKLSDDEGWTRIELPGKLSDRPISGAVWIRKEIEVPEIAIKTGRDFKVLLGDIEGFEQVYWNGTKVSETTYKTYPGLGYPRYFAIPQKLMRAGMNTIAVRVFAPAAAPVMRIDPARLKAGAVSLVGSWLSQVEYELPAPSAADLDRVPKAMKQAPGGYSGSIFNGVVSPILSYGVAGVVWYQGESDTPRAYEYRAGLRAMIVDWRAKWKQPKLPFYVCQLHSYGPKTSKAGESEYAEVRESQQAAVKDLADAGFTVLVDLGESNDEHPRNKKVPGERLAALVLAKQYGKEIAYSGPLYDSMAVEGDKIRVRFRHIDGGLVARPVPAVYDVSTLINKTEPLVRNSPGSELEGFSICGADGRWHWADARRDGDSVLVWSPEVAKPVAVRYGWADNPTVNLANGKGLPAAPFRTDSFPPSTLNSHYGPTP